MCPICNNKLIPVVYGMVNDRNLSLHREGKIILAGYKDRYAETYKSYCINCLEGSDTVISIID